MDTRHRPACDLLWRATCDRCICHVVSVEARLRRAAHSDCPSHATTDVDNTDNSANKHCITITSSQSRRTKQRRTAFSFSFHPISAALPGAVMQTRCQSSQFAWSFPADHTRCLRCCTVQAAGPYTAYAGTHVINIHKTFVADSHN